MSRKSAFGRTVKRREMAPADGFERYVNFMGTGRHVFVMPKDEAPEERVIG